MSTQLIKAALNVFIMAAVIISLVQDISSLKTEPKVVNQNQNDNSTSTEALPQITGVVIKASDNLMRPINQLLKAQQYNVKVEPYQFQGNQWYWQTGIKYGHIIIVYTLFGKYQSETDNTKKRRYMILGCVILFLWFTVLPKYKIDRLKIQVDGKAVYQNTLIVPNDIISSISDGVDIVDLTDAQDLPISSQQASKMQTNKKTTAQQNEDYNQDYDNGQFPDEQLF